MLEHHPVPGVAGKVALVTGGQQGIGRAIALALASAGADIVINYFDDEAAAASVLDEARSLGVRAMTIQCDVRAPAAPSAMIGTVVKAMGRIEVLVNNAGVFPRARFVDITEAQWDRVVETNLKGAFFCAQAAARAMIDGNVCGNIINIVSRALVGSSPLGTHYAASKGGLAALTRAMAVELARHGIRVNAVAPGLTDTAQPREGSSEQQLRERAAAMLSGRMGRPEEIAAVVVFLASDASSFLFGQTIHANGGAYMAQ
jgi:3-oxoacyl-[acyl-carrier protein] reductase